MSAPGGDRHAPSRTRRWITPLVLLLLCAGHFFVLRDVYVTHRFMITHDSIANIGPYQFAFTGLRTGVLPLWSAEMNAGEPLWPIVELHPAYDPVALVAFAIAAQLGATGVTAFSFVLLAWLYGFAFGGWLLARVVGLSATARLFVFVVLMWSSLNVLMLYQSQSLVIARWVPLALATGWWFVQGPGFARAALFGVVLGLALPGYQTPYLAVFAAVLALAGGRDTVALLRRLPRPSIGVAVLFPLAILLPTLMAAAEWLGMVPVARLAWPRGTRAVLLSDVLAPFLGRLDTESTLYVGVVPSLLALAGALAALRGHDRQARFWARTTAGIMLVFLGAPEMITGRDQPFLFVRDWSFVLPLVVLSIAMLGGVALDRVGSRLPRRWAPTVALVLVAVALLDLSLFTNAHYRRVAFPRTPELQAREPAPIRPATRFSTLRQGDFDIAGHAPFHKQGPAVWGIPSAFMDPEPYVPSTRPLVALGQIYTHGSHYFRLPRYHAVVTNLPRSRFDCVAGVTCPIVRLVPDAVVTPDFSTALTALSQVPAERLPDVITLEESEGGVPPIRSDPAAGSQAGNGLGRTDVRSYRASSVEFDVQMARPGFLYYADGYTPDWRAGVDGRPAPVLAADGAFKAVYLTAGSHRVSFEYRPWRYLTAFTIRAMAIFGGLAVFLSARRGAHHASEARTAPASLLE